MPRTGLQGLLVRRTQSVPGATNANRQLACHEHTPVKPLPIAMPFRLKGSSAAYIEHATDDALLMFDRHRLNRKFKWPHRTLLYWKRP